MTDLNEAEIQVLASLQQAADEALPADRASLEKGGERYWIYREDWSEGRDALYGGRCQRVAQSGDP